MQIDIKHIIGALVGMALGVGLNFLAAKGINVSCPAPAASPAAAQVSQ